MDKLTFQLLEGKDTIYIRGGTRSSGAGSSGSCLLSLLTGMCQRNETASKFSVVPALYVIQLQEQSHANRNGLSLIPM